MSEPKVLSLVTEIFSERLEKEKVDYNKIFMLESRGFLFAVPLSGKTGKPCFPFRKKGKLPGDCVSMGYGLEYGKDEIEIKK